MMERDVRKLADTALGEHPADLVVKDGILMDVYTGRMLPGRSVAMVDGWIAYVGPDAQHTMGPETRVIDAADRIICPGYIDAHTHLTNYFNMPEFLSYAVPSGVTTLAGELESYGFIPGSGRDSDFSESDRVLSHQSLRFGASHGFTQYNRKIPYDHERTVGRTV